MVAADGLVSWRVLFFCSASARLSADGRKSDVEELEMEMHFEPKGAPNAEQSATRAGEEGNNASMTTLQSTWDEAPARP